MDSVAKGLSLREAARLLRNYKEFEKERSKLAKTELLNLLRVGNLTASAIVPTQRAPIVDLPSRFWLTFPPERFDQISRNPQKKSRPGIIYVEVREIAEYYVEWVRTHPDDDTKDELISALKTQTQSEIIIRSDEWQRFVTSEHLTEQPPELPKRRRGKPALESWKEVLTYVAAELMVEPGKEPPAADVATTAAEKARKVVSDPRLVPKPATIADQVHMIYDLAREQRLKGQKR
jgi:hypothetical protein